jgi:hypothetical protein
VDFGQPSVAQILGARDTSSWQNATSKFFFFLVTEVGFCCLYPNPNCYKQANLTYKRGGNRTALGKNGVGTGKFQNSTEYSFGHSHALQRLVAAVSADGQALGPE